jgi:hypothetical protein
MLTRRAPTHFLVCTIALWVMAGFLPDQEALGADKAPAYHQQENVTGGSSQQGRNVSGGFDINGDPDEYAHSDTGTPVPGNGGGTSSRQGSSPLEQLLACIANWWSLVWGLPPQ